MWDQRKSQFYGSGKTDKGADKPIFKCKDKTCGGVIWPQQKSRDEYDQRPPDEQESAYKKAKHEMEQPTQGKTESENGVDATRHHVMRACNLYLLCVRAVKICIMPNMPEIAQDVEGFLAAVGQIYREAYTKRTDDGIDWYTYVDKMPDKPLKHE